MGEKKEELLKWWMAWHDHKSLAFTKHVAHIAELWNIPYNGTEDEDIRLYNMLRDMKSFKRKGFAWCKRGGGGRGGAEGYKGRGREVGELGGIGVL